MEPVPKLRRRRNNLKARRLIGIAAALLVSALTLADAGSASVFVLVAKRDISGKTGTPTESVEVRSDGEISLTDGSGAVLATAQLPQADLAAFEELLSDRSILASIIPDCVPMGADLPETEFSIEYAEKTLSVRAPMGCSLPPKIESLGAMLDAAERMYLPPN